MCIEFTVRVQKMTTYRDLKYNACFVFLSV